MAASTACADDRSVAGSASGPPLVDTSAGDGVDTEVDETGDGSAGDATGTDEGSDGASGPGDTSGGDTSGGGEEPEETGGADDGGPPSDEVPDNDYCRDMGQWEPGWSAKEEEILTLVNDLRASGTSCGSYGSFGPSEPLVMEPALRCAARKHSKDMVDRGFFDHTNPDGESPGDRFRQAGYSGSKGSENIAAGTHGPPPTIDQWLASAGHCANMMNPGFRELGVGFYPASSVQGLWTQAFGAP